MCLHPTNSAIPVNGKPGVWIDVVLAGLIGTGKSSTINMILGMPDNAGRAAKVSNDASPCTMQTTSYLTMLGTGLQCRLWDMRGLGEAVNANSGSFLDRMTNRVRQLSSQRARELKETLRERTSLGTLIVMWCIDATKIDATVHWQQFRQIYVEYCEKKAIPVIVITRVPVKATGWEAKCRDQLRQLDLEKGGPAAEDISLFGVRKYKGASSAEYVEDSKGLRDLIVQLNENVN